MRKKIIIIFGLLLVIVLVSATTYYTPEFTTNDKYKVYLFGGSGTTLTSGDYSISVTTAEIGVGNYSGSDLREEIGFLYLLQSMATDLNLSFGPDVSVFRVTGCGPEKTNYSALPEGQNASLGIDYLCNNATVYGTLQIRLSGALNTGWSIYASNTSVSQNLINLTKDPTTWKDLYSDLLVNECTYVWFNFTCINVTQNPGVYEEYRLI